MDGIDFRQLRLPVPARPRRRTSRSFREALALQHRLGVPSRELSVDEALAIVPQLAPDGLLAATYCELDGYASPESVVQWYARGLDVRQGCEVTGDPRRGRAGRRRRDVEGPDRLRHGRLLRRRLVARGRGDWPASTCRSRARSAGSGSRPRTAACPERLPLTIDFSTSFYFHREGPGIVFGGKEQTLEEVAEHGLRRLPLLADLPVQTSWWGYYEMSPDHNALVGRAAEPEGFFYATGFSGHGFQQAPAVGEHVAELIAGREPTLDLSAFDVGAVRARECPARGVRRDSEASSLVRRDR